ncbi:hypothetical protein H072_3977 [Dactylellina haptotyla CBS 200.50]|uniref:Uncharacterized protein n=1 Tax=Dactylellina haptotyla (strain CBS 200.50) TaxID=1284197 RepID=S8AGK9_DACHA|nr:hypothetical protein H072_3977 [Dactylellina haptotyla CBS 200.50]
MPCAGPYLPNRIHLTPRLRDSTAMRHYLKNGYTRSEASALIRQQTLNGRYQFIFDDDSEEEQVEILFECREREFLEREHEQESRKMADIIERLQRLASSSTIFQNPQETQLLQMPRLSNDRPRNVNIGSS